MLKAFHRHYFLILRYAVIASFLELHCISAYSAPSTVSLDIVRLQDLAETEHDQATKQMQALLQRMPDDATVVDRRELLIALIPLYIDGGDGQQAKVLNESLMLHGRQFHDPVASAMGLAYQASMLKDQGMLVEAIGIIEQALVISKTVSEARLNNEVNTLAGELYANVGNFKLALEHDLSAMALVEDGTRLSELQRAKNLNNISRLYLRLKDQKMAFDYNAKADALAKKLNARVLMANIANVRGYAFANDENWPAANAAYTEAFTIARSIGDRHDQMLALNNMADAALNQGKYPACVDYAQKSLAIAQKDGKLDIVAIAYGNIGVCHMNMGLVSQGAAEAKQGINFSRQTKATPNMESALGDLAAAYEKAGLYKDALAAMIEQRKVSEDLFQKERDKAVSELQVRFNLSERQKQIDVLEQRNKVQEVELENKGLQRIIAFLACIVVLVVSGLIAWLYRRARQNNLRLENANVTLVDQSTRDPLTGLLNRRAFQNFMRSQSKLPQHSTESGLVNVLILLDIDHFKQINDNFGHLFGDQVLIEIGRRLQSILRENDMLIRWGGEEFLIFLHGIPVQRVVPVVDRAINIVGESLITFANHTVSVTISAGYVLQPLPGVSALNLGWERALHLSDLALYMAKSAGRNQALGIEQVLNGVDVMSVQETSDLQRAIDEGDIVLRKIDGAQPKMS
ncbi:tetratricopeptide repeat-containing diguanylate cyclase [Undibacterium sp. RuRC25W]|uniref:tetratricopeptide repeat-containing diguanylate cyclase n=1 Tax=Undibacterium sp. RuRC25W TaxID=3413047 RepID=UPI003BF30C60